MILNALDVIRTRINASTIDPAHFYSLEKTVARGYELESETSDN